MTHYTFEVTAWTSVGPSNPKVATIQSGVEPVLPEPPTKLALSNIDAFSVVLQFTPGFDGNSSITKWTVQVNRPSDVAFISKNIYFAIIRNIVVVVKENKLNKMSS